MQEIQYPDNQHLDINELLSIYSKVLYAIITPSIYHIYIRKYINPSEILNKNPNAILELASEEAIWLHEKQHVQLSELISYSIDKINLFTSSGCHECLEKNWLQCSQIAELEPDIIKALTNYWTRLVYKSGSKADLFYRSKDGHGHNISKNFY